MSEERRKKVILGVLLAMLAVLVLRHFSPFGGSSGGAVGRGGRGAAADPAVEVAEFDLASLALERAVYSPGRDPFSYGAVPPPPAPEPTPAQLKAAERRAQERAAGGSDGEGRGRQGRGAAGPPRPRAPEVNVQYLGSFGPPQDRIAVFLDGEEIINAKVGDVLKGQFILQGIGFESADLGFVGFPNEPSQRLPAGG
jgi:hypothetical protein